MSFSHNKDYKKLYGKIDKKDILKKYRDTTIEPHIEHVFSGTIGRNSNQDYIIDGDTIKIVLNDNDIPSDILEQISEADRELITNGVYRYSIRLVGIDTPELEDKITTTCPQQNNGCECSRQFLYKLCNNSKIFLHIDQERAVDHYGRLLAVLMIDASDTETETHYKNINQILLKEGLAEILYVPPSEFTPYEWWSQDFDNQGVSLKSTIINQKKKIYLYVTQSKDLVWPSSSTVRSNYRYQIYVKNLSGQEITNLKIYITHPKEIKFDERQNYPEKEYYAIPTLKSGQSVLINVNNVIIAQEGYYDVTFIALGDETEIKTATLRVKCGYNNDNRKTEHRINFYNFTPYETAHMQRVIDYDEDVTQLIKIQTKPFEAKNQPFEMDTLELDLYSQDIYLSNTDDMPSMYLGREAYESNLEESYQGETFQKLLQKINDNSSLVDVDFIRLGNGEMANDLQRIYPNGFIHRFGLLRSEFYKVLGIIPRVISNNDDIFRWARSQEEIERIYPKRENDKWNQKVWCGTAYYVYEQTKNEDGSIRNLQIAIFTEEDDAKVFIEDWQRYNEIYFVENVKYIIKKREWLPGMFFVEIPLRDIPANFYLPDNDDIQAIIETTKPYGLKGYPRYCVEQDFQHQMSFDVTPNINFHSALDLDDDWIMNYYIYQKRYMKKNGKISLYDYGKRIAKIAFEKINPSIYNYYPKLGVIEYIEPEPAIITNDSENEMECLATLQSTVLCNSNVKSFNSTIGEHLNELLLKNPEDISFYIENPKYSFQRKNLDDFQVKIPRRYKTLNYYDENTSVLLQSKTGSAFKILKERTPQYVNVNFILSNRSKTKDFIISYKRLYDDIYQITYKTFKNEEVVIKDIITEFDHLLCDVHYVGPNRKLVKIYYSLNNKLYFFTAFSDDILYNKDDNILDEQKDNSIEFRVSLTNNLTLSSDVSMSNMVQVGNIYYGKDEQTNKRVYNDYYLCNKQYSNIISTDQYTPNEIHTSQNNWYKLYRINKDETSFAKFENTNQESSMVNSIELYLNDLNIPQNAIVDKIYLDLYTDSEESVNVNTKYSINTNLTHTNDNNNNIILTNTEYSRYFDNNIKYLYHKLNEAEEYENENNIKKYSYLISQYDNRNEDVSNDFSYNDPLKIRNTYWNELSFENLLDLNTNDLTNLYLVIEGYNHGTECNIDAQLVYLDGVGNITEQNIQSGYFYKKIPINFITKYNLQELAIRFKAHSYFDIDIYDIKAELCFSAPQKNNLDIIDGDEIFINGLNKYVCNIDTNLDGDMLRNGLSVFMNFSNIRNYLKIYSVVVNVVYHERAFTNIFETSNDFNRLNSSDASGIFRGCIFDEKVSDMQQVQYTTQKPNGDYDAGFEMNHRIYQAFTAEEDNITSIELRLNGKTGSPDNFLKIAVLDNYDNMPHNVLKEIIINTKQYSIENEEAYKYNICVNDLIPGNTYWFSIEPVDKSKNGLRRFMYNHYQIGDFKLLSAVDGDLINQHASLYFRLYSKNNKYSFKELPYCFDIEYDYTKKINLITEIQMLEGHIKNFEESMFSQCK